MKRFLIITLLVISIGIGLEVIISYCSSVQFKDLSSEEMYKQIINHRNTAIKKATVSGVYNCCIDPFCAICYMEANEWNNHTPGTCACDDSIAQGEEPCPQYLRQILLGY